MILHILHLPTVELLPVQHLRHSLYIVVWVGMELIHTRLTSSHFLTFSLSEFEKCECAKHILLRSLRGIVQS
jgi:hypothetical protein